MSSDTNPVFSGRTSSCWVDKIAPEDVLSGRGSGPNDHEGNVRFRNIVKRRKTDYNASSTHRGDKSKIAQEIVNITRENGARFLRKATASEREQLGIPEGTEEAWLLLDDKSVLEKAKQALRQKETQQQQSGDNVTAKKRESPRKRQASRRERSRQETVKSSPEPSQVQSQAAHLEPRFDAPSGDLHITNDDNTGLLDWGPSAPRYSEYGERPRKRQASRTKRSRQKTVKSSPEPSQVQSQAAHLEPRFDAPALGDFHVPNDDNTEPLDWRHSAPRYSEYGYTNQSPESFVAQWGEARVEWNDEPLTANIMNVNDDEEFFGQRF